MVSVSHIGIERNHLKQTAESEETQSLVRAYEAKKGVTTTRNSTRTSTHAVSSSSSLSSSKRRMWIVCYEQLQRQNGITLALLAFEHLLKEYPKYRKQVRFVLRCTPVNTRLRDRLPVCRRILASRPSKSAWARDTSSSTLVCESSMALDCRRRSCSHQE